MSISCLNIYTFQHISKYLRVTHFLSINVGHKKMARPPLFGHKKIRYTSKVLSSASFVVKAVFSPDQTWYYLQV